MLETSEAAAVDLARECLYRFLAAAMSDPSAEDWRLVLDTDTQDLARQAADLLREEARDLAGPLGYGELPAEYLDLVPLLDRLHCSVDDCRAEHDRVFGLVLARECPPYETEYHPTSETFFRSQQLADVAGFYRAFGLEPALSVPERPDHLALELEFMAFLLLKNRLALTAAGDPEVAERASACDEAQSSFCRDHLAWWLPAFTTGLRRKAGGGFYEVVGRVLAAFVAIERQRFGIPAPRLPLQPALIERPEEQSGCAGCAS
jgi:TorA maturation chaperone TorD